MKLSTLPGRSPKAGTAACTIFIFSRPQNAESRRYVTLAILAEGLFDYNLGDSEVLTLFLAVVACGYVARRCALENAAVGECKQVLEVAPPVA